MNQKYQSFKFEELPLMENEAYVGRIVRWEIVEDGTNGDFLNMWIELYVADGTFFLYSCRMSNKVNSWFYYFCHGLHLLKEDYTVDFGVLNSDCDVICKLKERPDGGLMVSSIEWMEQECIQ